MLLFVSINLINLTKFNTVWERNGDTIDVRTTEEPARFLLAAAQPLNEPMARYGPFVM